MRAIATLVLVFGFISMSWATGVSLTYQLPATGPLPQSYRVTLAVVDPHNPGWIVSQFICGATRIVTVENKGKFTETWDGLDDNYMPVPPGSYALKGIYMPARQWRVDGAFHTITPRFVGGASSWLPTPDQWAKPEPFGGDPCGAPLADVDVGPNGVAVFYYNYLENGLNNPMIDLKKPVGYEQFLRAFGSGGAGGGSATCTDGETVWSFSTDGGPKYLYRADGRPFGAGRAQRSGVYLPEGWVKALSCWHDAEVNKTFVFVAQGGKIIQTTDWPYYQESDKEFVDAITVHDGSNGTVLARLTTLHPLGVAARGGQLYVLHTSPQGGWTVSAVPLRSGLPQGNLVPLFNVPATITPTDLEVDSHNRLYLSDMIANKVYQLDRAGTILHVFGRLPAQHPGTYDPQTFCAPGKLATWAAPDGHDHLLVVEHAGPNRVSEWNDDGVLLRSFLNLQTKANDGYAVDPEHPEQIYIAGQQGWLTRFIVNYATGVWTVDAVWPNLLNDPLAPGLDHPWCIITHGHKYLACGRSNNIYRLDGDRWVLSAAILRMREGQEWKYFAWHDANGDGKIQEDEYRKSPLEMPGWLMRYHGNQWTADLALVALNQAGRDVERLAPSNFDAWGNPIFTHWEKLFTDPIFARRATGTATALYGGNELADQFASDWAMVDGSLGEGYYVTARGGPNFSANDGAQEKVTRYAPDARGGFVPLWRTGRKALQGVAQPGETYAAIHIYKPINGILSVVDQSRCGIILYTDSGLYIDTLFPDGRRLTPTEAGVYAQPGEFFAGLVYPNRTNGKIYFGMGKYTPMLYEAEGWSLHENPVHPLTTLPSRITISASQIVAPPEIALTVRGGAGTANVAHFSPALGGAILDGSLLGWEACEPIRFQADKDQTVEVRGLYDPEHLYLRWHVRLASVFIPRALQPLERIFTHDRLADTVSVYIQGDQRAMPATSPNGRPGDVRIICGLFSDGGRLTPVALGLYPTWHGPGTARPLTYRTPVNMVEFAHVGPVAGAELHSILDSDGKGFVLAVGLPRSAIPGLPPLTGGVRTMVNFDATFAGHNKCWWANVDGSASRETYDEPTEARLYPGSWAPAYWQGLDRGVLIRNWLICGPFGGPGAEKLSYDPNGLMPGTNIDYKSATRTFCEALQLPPDNGTVDITAQYTGAMIQGYWGNPGSVRWTPTIVTPLDTRVVLGPAGQVWYGATWIYVPAETTLDAHFQGHPMTYYRWFLNGTKILEGTIDGDPGQAEKVMTLTLRQGWNQVHFRAYCIGYPPFRAGLVLTAPPATLWNLRLSGSPPKN